MVVSSSSRHFLRQLQKKGLYFLYLCYFHSSAGVHGIHQASGGAPLEDDGGQGDVSSCDLLNGRSVIYKLLREIATFFFFSGFH